MSIEFRQRTVGEFFRMLTRRKWFIILPVLTMTVAVGYVVYKLPSVYESKTLLTVKPPQISDKVVQPLSNEDLTQRLQTINQEVLSRSSLEPLITKYNLFELERNAGMDMALIVDKMRKNIVVEVEKSDNEKLAAFRISYRDRRPDATRNVTSDLAGRYVNLQVLASTDNAEKTRDFLQKELDSAKLELNGIEQERLKLMMQNVETLPDSSQGLIAQLTNASSKRDSLNKEKESLIQERSRINDQISANNRQINTIETLVVKEVQSAARNSTRFEDTPAYAELVKKQTDLSARLKNLQTQYRDKHPEVVQTRNEIDEVKAKMDELAALAKKKEDLAVRNSANNTEIQKRAFENENKALQDRLTRIEQQISFKEQEIISAAGEINEINSKINAIPNVKIGLEGINSQYQSAKQKFDDLQKKINDASMQVNRESNAQGETIRVQDQANLPESPVAPRRFMLTGMGAGIGLVIGLMLAALFELPRVFKIQNIEDAKHYTGLPVLASVPPLLSHDEKVWLKRSHWLRVVAGVIAAVGAIPLIAMILQATKIFERFVS